MSDSEPHSGLRTAAAVLTAIAAVIAAIVAIPWNGEPQPGPDPTNGGSDPTQASDVAPEWGSSSWQSIENSHQPSAWCPPGSFVVALDLDEVPGLDAQDSPVISRALCATLYGASSSAWEQDFEMPVGALNSHGQRDDWCPDGMYIVGLDQDRVAGGAGDTPIVGSALCGSPSGSPYTSSDRSWHAVGFELSMTPSGPWCPDGMFVTRFDLDGGTDGHLYPIVASVECGRPAL